ncbi:MAG: hypothetical protein LCH52_05515 [Bacteroidetes bacterium]|nr:hypothetical protein [Bacteroidota bacterium]
MRIDIKEPHDEKLLQDAQRMGMSPTQYICYLLDNIEVEEPKQQKLVITKPSPKVKRKSGGSTWDANFLNK